MDHPVDKVSQSMRHHVNPSAVVGPDKTIPKEPMGASARMLQVVPAQDLIFVMEVTCTRFPTDTADRDAAPCRKSQRPARTANDNRTFLLMSISLLKIETTRYL